jgi:hypothetical protein
MCLSFDFRQNKKQILIFSKETCIKRVSFRRTLANEAAKSSWLLAKNNLMIHRKVDPKRLSKSKTHQGSVAF